MVTSFTHPARRQDHPVGTVHAVHPYLRPHSGRGCENVVHPLPEVQHPWQSCVGNRGSLLGYYLGSAFGNIEGVDRYFTLLVLAVFFIPGLPTMIHSWHENRERIMGWVRERLSRERAPENQLQHRSTDKCCVHCALR